MEKIKSFTVNHELLLPGLYVSRIDYVNDEIITTFDIRITRPNYEPVIDNAALHAMEHLGATFLRNHPVWKNLIIYFGPMGCRTGFYLIIGKKTTPLEIYDLIKELFEFIIYFEGKIPGASSIECGNYLELNLNTAKYYAKKYLSEVLVNFTKERYEYPA